MYFFYYPERAQDFHDKQLGGNEVQRNVNEAAHRHYRKRKLLDHNSNHWTLVVGSNLIDRVIYIYIYNNNKSTLQDVNFNNREVSYYNSFLLSSCPYFNPLW